MKLCLFGSTVRPNRMNERVLKLVQNHLVSKGHEVVVIDPLVSQLPLLDIPLHFYSDPEMAPPSPPPLLVQINEHIEQADAMVFTTAEYNRTVPPALSNLLDFFPHNSFAFKPASIVCYSIDIGGQVAASHLRQMLCELGCLIMPHCVELNCVAKLVSEDGRPQNDQLVQDLNLMLSQIQFVAEALKHSTPTAKPKVHPYT